MKTLAIASCCAIVLLATGFENNVLAQSGRYIVCYGSDGVTKRVYASRVWFYEGSDTQINILASSAFINFVNGNIPGAGGSFVNPICSAKDSAAEASSDADEFKSRYAHLGYAVFNTGWTYGGN